MDTSCYTHSAPQKWCWFEVSPHAQYGIEVDLCTCATICVELLSRDYQREHIEAGGYPAVICILLKREKSHHSSAKMTQRSTHVELDSFENFTYCCIRLIGGCIEGIWGWIMIIQWQILDQCNTMCEEEETHDGLHAPTKTWKSNKIGI